MDWILPFLVACVSSSVAALVIVMTKDVHGHLSTDGHHGVQKLHERATPRVGGLAIASGLAVGAVFLPANAQALFWLILLTTLPAFASGFLEDITKRVSARARLIATLLAGVLFCVLTGYHLQDTSIPGLDWLLTFSLFSIAFTAIVIAGVANALNIIDGVNGLSSGTAIIIFTGFAIIAGQHGDQEMMLVAVVCTGALIGFFLLNFPFGYIFLGDAGAYTVGMLLAVTAILLSLRNPEIAMLAGLLGLSYPVIEMLVSIVRRVRRRNAHPGQADRLHLHSLVHRGQARQISQKSGVPEMRNPFTAVIIWPLPLISTTLMVFTRTNVPATLACLAFMIFLYLWFYRRVALIGRRFRLTPQKG